MTLVKQWFEWRYGRLLACGESPHFDLELHGAQSFYDFLYEQGYMIVRGEIEIKGTIKLERKEP